MAVELEGLVFEVESKSDKAVKGIDSLTDSLNRLKNATKGGVGLNSTIKQLEKLDEMFSNLEKLSSLSEFLTGISKLNGVKISTTVPKRLNEISTAIGSITSESLANLRELTDTLSNLSNVGDIKIPKVPVFKTGKVRETATDTTSINEDMVEVAVETNRLSLLLMGLRRKFVEAFNVKQVIKSVASSIWSVTKALAKLSIAIPKKRLHDMIGSVKNVTSSLGRLFSSVKRIIMYRAIRAVLSTITKGFQEGIKNLYQWSLLVNREFANSMDKIATSSLYLKNSLAAMVAPLINKLAPAIDYVVDKFVDLLNTINQLFAKLTGADTYTAARKVATEWDGAESSVKDSVEAIKRYTLGFDELNILGKPENDKSTSKKDKTPDYASMFETLPVDSQISGFVERLKAAFEREDWKSIGTIIGNKINQGVYNVDWTGIGENIGTKINGSVQTVYWTLDTIDFKKIGSKIASLLNSALSKIDFEFVGRLIVKPFTSLLDLIIGAIETLDWNLVGTSLSDTLKGILNEWTKWFKSVDWNELGRKLNAGIVDLFEGVDETGVLSSLWSLVKTVFVSITNMIVGFLSASDFGDKIIRAITACQWDTESLGTWWWDNVWLPIAKRTDKAQAFVNTLAKTLKTTTVTDIITWWKENVIDKIALAALEKGDKMKESGSNLIQKLKDGISEKLKNIKTWFDEVFMKPIVDDLDKNPLQIAVELVKKLWTTVTDWLKKPANLGSDDTKGSIGLKRNGAWSSITQWLVDSQMGSNAVNGAIGLMRNGAWTSIMQWLGEKHMGNEKVNGAIGLTGNGAWTSVMKWILDKHMGTETVNGTIGLKRSSAWATVTQWVNLSTQLGTGNVYVIVNLIKRAWTTVTDWLTQREQKGNDDTTGKVGITTDGKWSTVTDWIKNKMFGNTNLDGQVGLEQKSYFKNAGSVTGWIKKDHFGNTVLDGSVGLEQKSYFKNAGSVTGWIKKDHFGNTDLDGSVGLKQDGWRDVTSWAKTGQRFGDGFLELSVDLVPGSNNLRGYIAANGGVFENGKYSSFASGGAINGSFTEFWNNIPKYASGTSKAHGSMFVAGEAGAELVGHVGGRTEVLNKSQLGQVMHKSILDGMSQYADYISSINNRITICANAVIAAIVNSANDVYNSVDRIDVPIERYDRIMNDVASRVTEDRLYQDDYTGQIAEGVREGLNESTARQNDYLREILRELRNSSDKKTEVVVTANQIVHALQDKNQRDGITTVPIYN